MLLEARMEIEPEDLGEPPLTPPLQSIVEDINALRERLKAYTSL
jgi:hypothetical protein